MTTQNKTTQATQAILAAGHQPTPELINAVLEEKAKDGRASFGTATRRALSGQTAAPDNGQTSGQRQSDSGQNGQSQPVNGQTPLEATTLAMAKNLKQRIVSDAFSIVLSELAAGDLGDFVNVPFDATGALEVDFSEVFSQPKFKTLPSGQQQDLRALPSNAGSKQGLSLPSSEMQSESKLNASLDPTKI